MMENRYARYGAASGIVAAMELRRDDSQGMNAFARSDATAASDRGLAGVARAAIEIACAGQLDRVPEFYDADFVDHVNGMVFHGHAGARESVGFYRSMFPDLGFEVDDQVTEGDRVATRWTMHGTYRGKPVALEGIAISRFRDGKIVEDHSYTDSLALLSALGPLRVLALVVDIVRGTIRLPRGAVRRGS
jgi:ketosteroid isomerase-like protein